MGGGAGAGAGSNGVRSNESDTPSVISSAHVSLVGGALRMPTRYGPCQHRLRPGPADQRQLATVRKIPARRRTGKRGPERVMVPVRSVLGEHRRERTKAAQVEFHRDVSRYRHLHLLSAMGPRLRIGSLPAPMLIPEGRTVGKFAYQGTPVSLCGFGELRKCTVDVSGIGRPFLLRLHNR